MGLWAESMRGSYFLDSIPPGLLIGDSECHLDLLYNLVGSQV